MLEILGFIRNLIFQTNIAKILILNHKNVIFFKSARWDRYLDTSELFVGFQAIFSKAQFFSANVMKLLIILRPPLEIRWTIFLWNSTYRNYFNKNSSTTFSESPIEMSEILVFFKDLTFESNISKILGRYIFKINTLESTYRQLDILTHFVSF